MTSTYSIQVNVYPVGSTADGEGQETNSLTGHVNVTYFQDGEPVYTSGATSTSPENLNELFDFPIYFPSYDGPSLVFPYESQNDGLIVNEKAKFEKGVDDETIISETVRLTPEQFQESLNLAEANVKPCRVSRKWG